VSILSRSNLQKILCYYFQIEIWIKKDDQGNGNHYQIIKFELGKELYLNEFCKEVHPDMWYLNSEEI